jgi:hypothetical protein
MTSYIAGPRLDDDPRERVTDRLMRRMYAENGWYAYKVPQRAPPKHDDQKEGTSRSRYLAVQVNVIWYVGVSFVLRAGEPVIAVLDDASRKAIGLQAPPSYSPEAAAQILSDIVEEVGGRPHAVWTVWLPSFGGAFDVLLSQLNIRHVKNKFSLVPQVTKMSRFWDAYHQKMPGQTNDTFRKLYNERPHTELQQSCPNQAFDELPRWPDAGGPSWTVNGVSVPFPEKLQEADRTVLLIQ